MKKKSSHSETMGVINGFFGNNSSEMKKIILFLGIRFITLFNAPLFQCTLSIWRSNFPLGNGRLILCDHFLLELS
jgi:hypothetical protein